MADNSSNNTQKWHHPSDVMKLHKLRQKKKALQARINGNVNKNNASNSSANVSNPFDDILSGRKRRNPFIKTDTENSNKKIKTDVKDIFLEESGDQTLFKVLNQNKTENITSNITSFDNILSKINDKNSPIEIVKAQGQKWLPIDWTLKSKMRLLSTKPFPFNCKLKISEEASGITAFTRCLTSDTETTLDTSPNSRFHQCCLLWQQPMFPWLQLFPRNVTKANQVSFASNMSIKQSLQESWSDSLRSLFQLIRTRQCPYFYACANNFTVLFRAAGICGYSDVHAMISPTTRGFRNMLKQEDIEFSMPLKNKGRISDQGYETLDSTTASCSNTNLDVKDEKHEEDELDNNWMQSMGLKPEDIKQINYTQAKIVHKSECEIDNSEQSLILVEGVEVHALYNFLINCKSATALTGTFAGIPPTLLAPVAFNGASLKSLKVRENKVHVDNCDYYSLDILGPILPCTIHNLFGNELLKQNVSVSYTNVGSTESFSKVVNKNQRKSDIEKGTSVFCKENLRDCGLNKNVLSAFCKADSDIVRNVECLKYDSENNTFTWT